MAGKLGQGTVVFCAAKIVSQVNIFLRHFAKRHLLNLLHLKDRIGTRSTRSGFTGPACRFSNYRFIQQALDVDGAVEGADVQEPVWLVRTTKSGCS